MNDFIKKYSPYFSLFFFVLLAQILRRSHGHLRFNHLVFMTLSLVVFIFFQLKRDFEFRKNDIITEKVLSLVWVLFSLFLVIGHEVIYSINNSWLVIFKTIFIFQLFLSILHFSMLFNLNMKKYCKPIMLISCFILFINSVMVLFVSPTPHIDVWHYAQMGGELLLNGVNPYSANYPDLYDGKYDSTHGFPYWPVATYFFTIGKYFGDVRISLIIAQCFSLLGIIKLSNSLLFKKPMLIILIWMSFPVTYFILEQSWLDGFLIPMIIWSFHYLSEKKLMRSALILGMMCMTKQYMLFYAILSFSYVFRNFGFKRSVEYTAITIFTALVLALPFILWDFQLFYQKTVIDLLNLSYRDDSLSWVAYLLRFYNYRLSPISISLIYMVSTLLLSFWVWRKSRGRINVLISSLIVNYLVVFLFGKQAFCNYYYLVCIFLLSLIMFDYRSDKESSF